MDVDIKGYLDNIPHGKLMQLVEMHISDRRVFNTNSSMAESGSIGGQSPSRVSSRLSARGSNQPLLANVYLNYLDTVWERHYSHFGHLFDMQMIW